MRHVRIGVLSAIVLASAAVPQNAIPVHDLGLKQAGETQELTLTAQNIDCQQPQDFQFQLDNMPWLTADGPLIVRGLGPGQSKSIKATLDFQYTNPGVHYGRVTSRCITCGWYLFSSCNENASDVVIKVTVGDPSATAQANQPDINPYAGMTPRQPVDVSLVKPVDDEDVRVLKSGDRKDLESARAGLRTAEARGQKAQDTLDATQRRKSDCERVLARLKAEAENARRAAGVADQDAKKAASTAKAAKEALENFERDNRRALKAVDDTGRAVIVAVRYRDQVEEADGTGSERYRRAQDQVDRFQQEHFDALREHTDVSKSRDQRKAAAEQSAKEAADAKAKAEATETAADTAERKVKEQEKLCRGEADALIAAQKALDGARAAAEDAVRNANKAEARAAGQAAERLDDRIKRQRQKCKDMEARAKAEIAEWQEAIAAGQKLKMLDDDGGHAASAMKAINDKIWDSAQDLAQDHTIATVDNQGNLGLSNDETADLASADTAEDVLDRVSTLIGWAVEEMSFVRGSKGVPDFGQSQMLNGMKALGLGMQNMVNAIRNPNTYAAQRDRIAAELNKDENYLEREMREKGIGKNAKDRTEILNRIDQLHNNRNLIANLTDKNARAAARCVAELRDMERRREELAKKAEGG